VLICPPNVVNSAMLRKLAPTRVAVVTGWAVDANCRYRYQAHAAFPLSDHADFSQLIEFVTRVWPKRIYTLHRFAADFAQPLRGLGYAAQALSEDEQLQLPLSIATLAHPLNTDALSLHETVRHTAAPTASSRVQPESDMSHASGPSSPTAAAPLASQFHA